MERFSTQSARTVESVSPEHEEAPHIMPLLFGYEKAWKLVLLCNYVLCVGNRDLPSRI